MRFYLFILSFCVITTTLAQELKIQRNGNELYSEEFTVLKSDRKVRHGEYKSYKNGQLNITGNYEEGKKVGVWKFYQNGVLVQSFDFSKNVLEITESDDTNFLVFDDNRYVEKEIQNPPTYIGGKVGLERALNGTMRYPEQARRMGLDGLVLFSLVVDEHGVMSEVEFISGPDEFHAEIKNALGKIDQSWIAGSSGESKIKCKLFYAMEFKLLMCGSLGCSTMFIR